MNMMPTLTTERLILLPFTLDDASELQKLAGARAIADTTINIPHPYPEGAAEKWISTHRDEYQKNGSVAWAVVLKDSPQLIGCISLGVDSKNERAELGYWISQTFWGRGYCTEAAKAVLGYGFRQTKLNRIFAFYLSRNPASGKVMAKIGMKKEGEMRQHIKKWDQFEDIIHYGILDAEYNP
ncbi:MAG: GNAT family N-acetyltransferase [Candidatus Edwardsbacteria bacterium]|nr:GNAT family N-acetyltransferase [Candidatus Edwardsbacteria bacterium]